MPLYVVSKEKCLLIYLFLMEKIVYLKKSKTIMTKRDLYYQNCTLFKNQNVCNSAIDDIAISMGVTRFDLGIIAIV